ncbi:MAG: MarR family transcriptional regulator [Sphingomonas sp.]
MVAESEAWRHSNIGRLLNNAIRRFEARVLEVLAEEGYSGTRLSHINLTRNLDLTGTRITELARRAALTKQAMSELVLQCEKLGLVTVVQDSSDGRAKLVLFTKEGNLWMEAFKLALKVAEDEMREELGTLRVDGIAVALKAYAASFDPLVRD